MDTGLDPRGVLDTLVTAMWPDSAVFSPQNNVFRELSHPWPGGGRTWQMVAATADCLGRESPERLRLLVFARIEARRRAAGLSVKSMCTGQIYWSQSRAEYYRERDWALARCAKVAAFLGERRAGAEADRRAAARASKTAGR